METNTGVVGGRQFCGRQQGVNCCQQQLLPVAIVAGSSQLTLFCMPRGCLLPAIFVSPSIGSWSLYVVFIGLNSVNAVTTCPVYSSVHLSQFSYCFHLSHPFLFHFIHVFRCERKRGEVEQGDFIRISHNLLIIKLSPYFQHQKSSLSSFETIILTILIECILFSIIVKRTLIGKS